MGMDLAARLRNRGIEVDLNAPLPAAPSAASSTHVGPLKSAVLPSASAASISSTRSSKGAAAERSAPAAAAGPVPMSKSDFKSLFTPLLAQGAEGIERERRLKLEVQDDIVKGVHDTLIKWVQLCLTNPERQKSLLEKGMLKCRVQATWSEGLHEKLKKYMSQYGSGVKLKMDGDKENADRPAYAAYLQRSEKWHVGFDTSAFEAFVALNPGVLDPPSAQVRALVEEAVKNKSTGALAEALQKRFGPLRQATLDRANSMIASASSSSRQGVKRKASNADDQELPESKKARIASVEDVAWVASTLSPMGLKADSGEPVVRAPSSVIVPLFEGLSAMAKLPNLRNILRETQIGKVIAGYRHHPNAEIAKVAKELVTSWKSACKEK